MASSLFATLPGEPPDSRNSRPMKCLGGDDRPPARQTQMPVREDAVDRSAGLVGSDLNHEYAAFRGSNFVRPAGHGRRSRESLRCSREPALTTHRAPFILNERPFAFSFRAQIFPAMLGFSFKSAGLPVAAFCWALQLAGSGTPTTHAGCGDYVHLGGITAPIATPGTATHAPRDFGNHSRFPCHGPHCRQTPATPGAPTPAEPSSGPDQKACLARHDLPVLNCSRVLLPDSAVHQDKLSHARIDRPPRTRV